MCGRYFIDMDIGGEELEEIVASLNRRDADGALKTSGEVFPTDVVPVIALSRAGRVRPFAMRWGYSLPGGRRVINARSETADERPMFADGLRSRRCLIPASGYYEWLRHDTKGQKYAIRSGRDRTLYMAGVYRFENGSPVFAILTRAPGDPVAFIHDRMPVILPREAARDWLNTANDAHRVLRAAVTTVTATTV